MLLKDTPKHGLIWLIDAYTLKFVCFSYKIGSSDQWFMVYEDPLLKYWMLDFVANSRKRSYLSYV